MSPAGAGLRVATGSTNAWVAVPAPPRTSYETAPSASMIGGSSPHRRHWGACDAFWRSRWPVAGGREGSPLAAAVRGRGAQGWAMGDGRWARVCFPAGPQLGVPHQHPAWSCSAKSAAQPVGTHRPAPQLHQTERRSSTSTASVQRRRMDSAPLAVSLTRAARSAPDCESRKERRGPGAPCLAGPRISSLDCWLIGVAEHSKRWRAD